MLKDKNGNNPFAIIEMLADNLRPSDSVIQHAKSFYPMICPKPDLVRAWDKKVIFGFYHYRKGILCLDEMIFSEGNIVIWEAE